MVDTTAPLLLRTAPTDNATGVSVTSNLALGFNEAVKAGSGLIKIYKSDGTLFHSIAASDTSQVTIDSTGTRVNPSVSLLAGTGYYVIIEPGAFEDLAGNDYAGLSSPTAFNFTTAGTGGANPPADTTAPLLTNTSPADNAANVSVDSNIVLTFSEPIKLGNPNGTIRVYYADDTFAKFIYLDDTSQVSISANTLTVNPTTDLLSQTAYYVTLGPGNITDLAGKGFAGFTSPTTLSFVTGSSTDTAAPLLSSTLPADNSTGLATSLTLFMYFNEGVKAGTGSIEIHRTSDQSLVDTLNVTDSARVEFYDNRVMVFPHSPLDWSTEYYVTFAAGVVRDYAGNNFAGISSNTAFTFTTMGDPDTSPPILVASFPYEGYGPFVIDGNISLIFSEFVQAGTGAVEIRRSSDGALATNIDIRDVGQVTIYQNRVTVDPDINLDPYTQYYVLVSSGAIQDLSGSNYVGISSVSALSFTTGPLVPPPPPPPDGGVIVIGGTPPDTISPSLTAISPVDNASNVPTGSNIVLTFNEGVQAGIGTIQVHKVSDGSLVKSIALSDPSQVQFSGATITINPSTDLSAGTPYYVVLESGAVKDGSGNPYAGFSSPVAFNFTTASSASGLVLTGNGFSNTLTGGSGNDVITGLGRADMLTGGGGSDKFVYSAVSESTGRIYDTITDFNASTDLFDLWFQVTGVDTSVTSGSLSARRFDSDLASAVGATKLASHHAVLFTPNAGSLAHSTFLIVDANGMAGYQANADLVILLGNASSLGGLTATDFV